MVSFARIAVPFLFVYVLIVSGCSNDNSGSKTIDESPSDDTTTANSTDIVDDTENVDAGDQSTGEDDGNIRRDDISLFPSECTPSCQDACDAVAKCGDSGYDISSLDTENCFDRCNLAQDGPMWDDVSVNFRCCASQESCEQVSQCGDWLSLPATKDSCNMLCICMFGKKAQRELWGKLAAPPGYKWATDSIVVEQVDHSTPFSQVYGAKIVSQGHYAFLKFPRQLTNLAARAMSNSEKILPTFVDGNGIVAAAAGSLVVSPSSRSEVNSMTALASLYGFEPPRRLSYSKNLFELRSDDGFLALEAFHALTKDNIRVELDMLRTYEKRHTPNDTAFEQQWHLENTGQQNLAIRGVDSRVSEAWDLTTGNPEVIIAILDDGVDVYHPDLSDKIIQTINYSDDWEDMLEAGQFGWHGTNCAGVAAAAVDNAEGGAGVCPNCSLIPALLAGEAGLTPGPGFQLTELEIADLFEKIVDAGAWIISNSWGPAGEDPSVESPGWGRIPMSLAMIDVLEYAETTGRNGKGTVVLFASGNSNQSADGDPYAMHEYIISVGAVDDQGLKSSYSNYGNVLTTSAPSNGGHFGIFTTAAGVDSEVNPTYNDQFGGTSSACPFVAGVAGLVLSANPDLSASQVRDILSKSGTKIDPVWGKWDESGHSPYYGGGLINSYRAIKMAEDVKNGTTNCDLPENCRAPSDDCGESCGKAMDCDECRTHADCATGYVCQSLPALGASFCVQSQPDEGCAEGFELENGYCLPTRKACGLCSDSEVCNGRDDNCNDLVDDSEDCTEGSRCLQQNRGCIDGRSCTGTSCGTSCTTTDDCEDGECKAVKDRYGKIHSNTRICSGGTLYCEMACQAIISSKEDNSLNEFLECMEPLDCDAVFTCMMLLND